MQLYIERLLVAVVMDKTMAVFFADTVRHASVKGRVAFSVTCPSRTIVAETRHSTDEGDAFASLDLNVRSLVYRLIAARQVTDIIVEGNGEHLTITLCLGSTGESALALVNYLGSLTDRETLTFPNVCWLAKVTGSDLEPGDDIATQRQVAQRLSDEFCALIREAFNAALAGF